MKLCVLTNNLDFKNGAGRFSIGLISHLEKLNPTLEIKVLTTVSSDLKNERSILYSNKFKLLFNFWLIRRELKSCDLIHAIDVFPYGIIAAIATLGFKKKIIITID